VLATVSVFIPFHSQILARAPCQFLAPHSFLLFENISNHHMPAAGFVSVVFRFNVTATIHCQLLAMFSFFYHF
jgi:hypothetical protein